MCPLSLLAAAMFACEFKGQNIAEGESLGLVIVHTCSTCIHTACRYIHIHTYIYIISGAHEGRRYTQNHTHIHTHTHTHTHTFYLRPSWAPDNTYMYTNYTYIST